jgi:hypothetical protein
LTKFNANSVERTARARRSAWRITLASRVPSTWCPATSTVSASLSSAADAAATAGIPERVANQRQRIGSHAGPASDVEFG